MSVMRMGGSGRARQYGADCGNRQALAAPAIDTFSALDVTPSARYGRFSRASIVVTRSTRIVRAAQRHQALMACARPK
jgi:hypothetical protein